MDQIEQQNEHENEKETDGWNEKTDQIFQTFYVLILYFPVDQLERVIGDRD